MNSVNEVKKVNSEIGGGRSSNLELFRIISMLVIVSHHYVVNSGLMGVIAERTALHWNDLFLLIFGWGGKTAINGFVLITGYFMCKSKITVKKFCKLLFEIEFYKIVFYAIFVAAGYQRLAFDEIIKVLLPVRQIGDGFTSAYLVFFLLIPFLNKLIGAMEEREHRILVTFLVTIYSVMPSVPGFGIVFNYVEWFAVLYMIASYVRLYPKDIFENAKLWGVAALLSLLLSWASVALLAYVKATPYYFVSDSNKIMALATAFSSFMYFLNLRMKPNRIVNGVAASAFGVLLIHANSDTMRQWLWKDTLRNVEYYNNGSMVVIHAVFSVVAIYIVCTIIDILRIRFVEKPVMEKLFL